MTQKAPRIPEQIWNQHKETIIPFYKATSLPETMEYMAEQHGFRATKNQYTDKLSRWGIKKNHASSDWAVIHSTKRKRSEQGKESDVYIRERKYTRKEQEKEIARHVPLGREWCDSEDALPDYITVCTPKGEAVGVHRNFLLRDLPWYRLMQQMQVHVSGILGANMALSTPGTFLERAIANLDPQWEASLPPLTVEPRLFGNTKHSLSAYLPPEDRDTSRLPAEQSMRLRKESPLSVFQAFLKHVIFLSANNLLHQGQFDKVYDWILEKGGENILVFLCQLRPPLNEVLAKKVLYSAASSGNVALARKVLHCRIRLQPDNPSQREFWTGCLAIAVYHGNRAMVELLCEARLRLEINRYWWRDDWDLRLPILHTLLDFNADPERFITDKGAGFPLVDAALNGSVGAVELLLNKGSRVNLCLPEYYGTALQAAVSRGHSEVAEYLTQHGADTNIANIQQIQLDGWDPELSRCQLTSILTPVQIAAKVNDVRLLQTLLQHGASATACPISACDGIVAYICNSVRKGRPLRKNHQYDKTKLICTALQYGIINQNLEVVARLLSAGASPDAGVAPGVDDTPLQMSTRLGNAKIFQMLSSWGACIHAPAATYNGRTAMQGAAQSGNWEIISMLLRAGAQINEPPGAKQGMTALQAACLNGHSMVAGVLFARGAQLNAHPSAVAGLTPLQAAAAHGDIGLVQDLIALGSDVNAPATEGGMTALFAAMEHNNLPLLKLLAQHGADVNATADRELQSPLMIAASNNWFDGVRFLLKSSARVNDPLIVDDDDDYDPDYLFTPLGWAIRNDSEEMIDLLLQHGADVAAVAEFSSGLGALMYALHEGSSFEVIDLLLKNLPILEEHPGWERVLELILLGPLYDDTISRRRILDRVKLLPPLLRRKAAQGAWNQLCYNVGGLGELDNEEEHMQINIGLLLEFGASLDSRDWDESTLLMRTARFDYERPCSYLISRGATINARAARHWGTALQEAIKESNINIANILLDHGADINAFPAEIRGVTALQAASINGLFELAIRLLERGADVAAPAAPKYGRTAIDGAAERGYFDMVKLLLNAYPEDADMKTIRCQAACYAEKQGHIDLAGWLREG